MTPARPAISFRASATSSARCTKESAIQSTPALSAASRSARSLSVSAGTGISRVGKVDALAVGERAAEDHLMREYRSAFGDLDAQAAVIEKQTVARLAAAKISGWGRWTRVLSPGVGSVSKTKVSPGASGHLAPGEGADAELGALQVGEDADRPAGFRLDLADDRGAAARSLSWSVWLILMRKTSAPASKRRLTVALSEEEGPSVARILALRSRLIDRRFRFPWARSIAPSSSFARRCRPRRNRFVQTRARHSPRCRGS